MDSTTSGINAAEPAALQANPGAGVANGQSAAGVAIPAQVAARADVDAGGQWNCYTATAAAEGGNRAFLIDSDSENTIYYVQNMQWPTMDGATIYGNLVIAAATAGNLENAGAAGGGEAQYNGGTWTTLK
jgi:hypothetical protein